VRGRVSSRRGSLFPGFVGLMREFLAVVNIPSGYRVHQFRVLSACLLDEGIRFRAMFMAKGRKDRLWRYRRHEFGFEHAFTRGVSIRMGDRQPLHVSPGAWVETVRSAPEWLLLGGSWYQPAVMISTVYSGTAHNLFWNESWQERVTRFSALRHLVLARCDGFVVPGERAESWTLTQATGPILRLPNFVDESLFGDRVDEERRRADIRGELGFGEEIIFAWPARLNQDKGIVPFLKAVRDIDGDYSIAIAGEGPQRDEIERVAAMMPRVRLLGHLWPEDLLRLYAVADALLLPSLFEPFGFVAVEALWARLPLLLSDRVGAAPEVMIEGENGWIVPASDPAAASSAFEEMVGLGRAGLSEMGERSRTIAEERFASEASARGFVARLLEVFPS